MTHAHTPARNALRRATAALLAAVALPATLHAQETVTPPVILAPTTPAPAPAPAPVPAPPPTARTPSETGSRTTIAPGVLEQAQQEARERAAAQRSERAATQRTTATTPRPAPAPRAVAPADPAPAAPVAAQEPATPPAATPVETTPPPAAAPVDPVIESEATPPPATEPTSQGNANWLILAGLGAIAAAIAALMLLRRRRDPLVEEEPAYVRDPAPLAAADPVETTPVTPVAPVIPPVAPVGLGVDPIMPALAEEAALAEARHEPEVRAALENPTLHRPDAQDVAAVLGGAAPHGNRPQLEFAMRPLRAGLTRNAGIVEFELTIANAGGAPAEDVRIGAFMLNGATSDSTMERLLTNPPREAVVDAEAIQPGEGTRVDAAVTLPRRELEVTNDGAGHEGFSPLLLADARYRLPDGSEGRTAAAFAIGRVDGSDSLAPIALDDGPAMYDDIEARLHSVPAKV